MSVEGGQLRRYALEGRYDALRSSELERQLQQLLDEGAITIELDLRQTTYMSSSALRVLLIVHRRAVARGGGLVLTHVPPRIARMLRMAGLDRVFALGPASGEGTA